MIREQIRGDQGEELVAVRHPAQVHWQVHKREESRRLAAPQRADSLPRSRDLLQFGKQNTDTAKNCVTSLLSQVCCVKETEVKNFVERLSALRTSNTDALIAQLECVEKHVAADRLFAVEFYARGGKKCLVEHIRECDKSSDAKKWFVIITFRIIFVHRPKKHRFKCANRSNLRNLMFRLYEIMVVFVKNWSIMSWETSGAGVTGGTGTTDDTLPVKLVNKKNI